jgi:hypothetical protein
MNFFKKEIPQQRRELEKTTYGRQVATFNRALRDQKRMNLDYTPESTGETVTSEADEFMNVVMDSDHDVFAEASVNEPVAFENPNEIETVTTTKAQAPAQATATKSKTPYVLGALGILAYFGMKD